MAAVDIFLAIDGITGESTDDRHADEIEVLGFSWGVAQAIAEGGKGTGRAGFEDLLVSCAVSTASPELWIACAAGTHFPSAVLTCRRSGEDPHDFLEIELEDITVSSYRSAGSEQERPLDQLALVYSKIRMTYTGVDRSGRPGPPVTAGWDVKRNAKV